MACSYFAQVLLQAGRTPEVTYAESALSSLGSHALKHSCLAVPTSSLLPLAGQLRPRPHPTPTPAAASTSHLLVGDGAVLELRRHQAPVVRHLKAVSNPMLQVRPLDSRFGLVRSGEVIAAISRLPGNLAGQGTQGMRD